MENEKQLDLIDRKALITEIQGTASTVCLNAPWDADWFSRLADRQEEIVAMIERQPKADAVEAVHGRWVLLAEFFDGSICTECSVCGEEYTYKKGRLELIGVEYAKYNYCPNCGAKMDGDGNGMQ